MRVVKINAVLNGWIARVGCQTMIYVSKEALLKDLGEYMDDPGAKEKQAIKDAVNPHPNAPSALEPTCAPESLTPNRSKAMVGAALPTCGSSG